MAGETIPQLIAAELAAMLKTDVSELKNALPREPQKVPRGLPIAALLLIRDDPQESETGHGYDVTYQWRLNLYLPLQDWDRAQDDLARLQPKVTRAILAHPTGLATEVDFMRVNDPGSDPVFAAKGPGQYLYLRKELVVTAQRTEQML